MQISGFSGIFRFFRKFLEFRAWSWGQDGPNGTPHVGPGSNLRDLLTPLAKMLYRYHMQFSRFSGNFRFSGIFLEFPGIFGVSFPKIPDFEWVHMNQCAKGFNLISHAIFQIFRKYSFFPDFFQNFPEFPGCVHLGVIWGSRRIQRYLICAGRVATHVFLLSP